MSTASEREAALRRALLSAAEQIEPAPGGLERIQARLRRPRPASVAWLDAAWTVLVMRAPDVTEAIRRRAVDVLRLAWERFGPRSAAGPGPHRLSWLRPLAAMSVAVFVLGGGAYVALQSVSSPIFPAGGVAGIQPGSGSHTAGRQPSGRGTTDGHASQSPYSSASSSPGSSQTCSPSPTPDDSAHASTGTPRPSSSATASPSQSTSPATSPSPSAPASSTPASTTSPSSGGSVASPDAGGSTTTDSARHNTRSANATRSAKPTTTNLSSGKNPCPSPKSKAKHGTKTSLTSAQLAGTKLAQAQPGSTVAAKLA